MVVDRSEQSPRGPEGDDGSQSGQSILEFLLMLPMMIGLVVIMIRVNTTIQISIVNQQYARMHALWLTFNSAVYPSRGLLENNLLKNKDNQMVIGVSDNTITKEETRPEAATHYIARKKGVADRDDKAPSERANVRIRDTVTICTQSVVVQGQSGLVPVMNGIYNLTEDPRQFAFCRSNMKYVINPDGDT